MFRFKLTKTQVRVDRQRTSKELRQKPVLKKSDNNAFFRLIRALMADPDTTDPDTTLGKKAAEAPLGREPKT